MLLIKKAGICGTIHHMLLTTQRKLQTGLSFLVWPAEYFK
jgi:hypothetical protein